MGPTSNKSFIKQWTSFHFERKFLALIIFAAVLARLATAFYLGDVVVDMPGTFDQISYHNLAIRVANGHGFTFGTSWWPATAANEPTAHWSYLYTAYLVGIYQIFGIHPLAARIIQAILVGILHPLLVYLVGEKVFGQRVGLIAAAITAGYAYFVYYAATLMTEPFYITAILAIIYFAIALRENLLKESDHGSARNRAWLYTVALGLSLGVAVLLRQLFIILGLFLMIWLLWSLKRRSLLRVVVVGGILALCILPFTIFNYTRFNRLVLLNTNAGFAFFWGNHPVYGTHFEPILPEEMGTYQDLIPPELLSLDEAALDQALLKEGIQFITADPVRYINLTLSRIPVYFKFWPSPDSGEISNLSRVFSFGVFWPFMLAGMLIALFDLKRNIAFGRYMDIILIIGFMVIYTGIHLLSWTLIRYRLPVDAVAILFAGLTFEKILLRIGVVKKVSKSQDEDLLHYTLHT